MAPAHCRSLYSWLQKQLSKRAAGLTTRPPIIYDFFAKGKAALSGVTKTAPCLGWRKKEKP
jgi:hypothetical protein